MIKIHGVVGGWEVDPDEIVSQIESQSGDIEISLDSVGGSVLAGIQIANAIRDYQGGSVTVTGGAIVASIATYIAMQADKFVIRDNTTFMIHNAWLPAAGDFRELRKAADISEGLSGIIAKSYTSKTSYKEEEIKNMMNEETYLYGDEIKNGGFADEIKKTENELNKSEAMALTMESLKACNSAIIENEVVSFEAVAKLLPKKDDSEIQQEAVEVIDTKAQLKRQIRLKLTQGK